MALLCTENRTAYSAIFRCLPKGGLAAMDSSDRKSRRGREEKRKARLRYAVRPGKQAARDS